MRPAIVHLLRFLACFVVPFLFVQSCTFDKNDDSLTKIDPCKSIKLDPKRKYKDTHDYLELHVRLCQICEYNCDFKKDKAKDNLANLTEACTSEEGCTKRYISHQGCPYTPPSEFYKEPKCFFDDSLENLFKDPCTGYGDEDQKEEDPQDLWDKTHKYKVLEGDISQKVRHAEHLFKNAFVDVCPPPNAYDIGGIIIAALLCMIKGCTRRYIGWRVCPADADHAIKPFSIDINSMTEVLKMLTDAILEFNHCMEHGGLCRDNNTNIVDAIESMSNNTMNGTQISGDIWRTINRNCTAWDAFHH